MTHAPAPHTPTPFEAAAATPRAALKSQATAVEQSRAVAEVQAAAVMAKTHPRDRQAAMREMQEVCAIPALADRAFFSFKRGTSAVTGPSIHLARELARCWRNIVYGVKELARDDAAGHSEMLAFAWDIETNTRSETTFIVPHVRDTSSGRKALTDVRDVYENNANQGARRVRECIFGVLPRWFTDEAEDICRRTLNDGDPKTLPQRIQQCVEMFGAIGVEQRRLEARIGRPAGQWSGADLGQLRIVLRSIRAGEATVEEMFDTGQASSDARPTGGDAFEQASAGGAVAFSPGKGRGAAKGAGAAPKQPEKPAAAPPAAQPTAERPAAPPAPAQAAAPPAGPAAEDETQDPGATEPPDDWADAFDTLAADLAKCTTPRAIHAFVTANDDRIAELRAARDGKYRARWDELLENQRKQAGG